ncbi:GAF domain-containing protein [Arthrobacter sp. B0490]|uniref:GAF domain-containing protein n=1 Tax=Arthrobacter sp. B0490 TaxID=2058891 RepID=UPI0011AFDEFE|nr:GAF domain-containing protein [Arthrobacter sp. B0490]
MNGARAPGVDCGARCRPENRHGDGPCPDAAATGISAYCSDTTKDPRWPTYPGRLDTGRIRSILGVPFALEGDGQAALNLYSVGPDAFVPAGHQHGRRHHHVP